MMAASATMSTAGIRMRLQIAHKDEGSLHRAGKKARKIVELDRNSATAAKSRPARKSRLRVGRNHGTCRGAGSGALDHGAFRLAAGPTART
jgi:hypothetical protein